MKQYTGYFIIFIIGLLTLKLSLAGLHEQAYMPVVYELPPVKSAPAVFPKWKDTSVAHSPAVRIPKVGKDFVGFKEALAFNESGRRYHVVNKWGYLGKYQFGMQTLRQLNVKVSHREFLNNPSLQEEAFKRYVRENRKILASEIKHYSGRYINGVKITESGILAAAHLAGAGAVKKFLRSRGKITSADALGTRIEDYLQKFGGYDLGEIR